ncbi:MAG: hypothetical protein Q4E36_01390 [Bacillota bacterium]|nr:hypothetical protein [Bacillota bacterium]
MKNFKAKPELIVYIIQYVLAGIFINMTYTVIEKKGVPKAIFVLGPIIILLSLYTSFKKDNSLPSLNKILWIVMDIAIIFILFVSYKFAM